MPCWKTISWRFSAESPLNDELCPVHTVEKIAPFTSSYHTPTVLQPTEWAEVFYLCPSDISGLHSFSSPPTWQLVFFMTIPLIMAIWSCPDFTMFALGGTLNSAQLAFYSILTCIEQATWKTCGFAAKKPRNFDPVKEAFKALPICHNAFNGSERLYRDARRNSTMR